jgi:hypothetical protein
MISAGKNKASNPNAYETMQAAIALERTLPVFELTCM